MIFSSEPTHHQFLLCTLLMPLLPGCTSSRHRTIVRKISIHAEKKTSAIPAANCNITPTITVWIHGTRLFASSVFKRFFHSEPGLKKATDMDSIYHLHTIAHTLCESDSAMFCIDDFYLFGWSGKLSFSAREQAAKELYKQLVALIHTYKKDCGVTPNIRFLTHSHGGNVALNLSKIKNPDDELSISELILLACPVQLTTHNCIKDPMFQKVYSIYSHLDLVQVLDPQGLYRKRHRGDSFLSKKCFEPHEKLAQVKIKLNGRALIHSEFIMQRFLKQLATIVKEIKQWKQEFPDFQDEWTYTKKVLCLYTNGHKVRPLTYLAHNNKQLRRVTEKLALIEMEKQVLQA